MVQLHSLITTKTLAARRGFLALARASAVVVMAAAAVPGAAQAQNLGSTVSPVLTLDRERLFLGTLYGQRVNAELEAATNAMAAETRRIEAALEVEEKALTAERATLDAETFRARAQAFDEKVQALRADREKAQASIGTQAEAARIEFFNRIGPVLGTLVRERGALLIVDRRAILLAATDVDITREAIARIDAEFADGRQGEDQGGAEAPTPSAADGQAEPEVSIDSIPAPAPVPEDADVPDGAENIPADPPADPAAAPDTATDPASAAQ